MHVIIKTILKGILFFAAGFPLNTWGQACCSGGVPISSNLGLGSQNPGTIQVQLTYDYNHLRDLVFISQELDDQTRTRNTHSVLLESSYDFSPVFSISGLFSWVRQERIISTLAQPDITINQGVGDAILLFRYKIIGQQLDARQQWVLGAGPKFPLGRTDFTDRRGIQLPADLQPGTGAWDVFAWSQYRYQGVFGRENLGLSLTTTFRFTTTNLRYNGQQAYRFGNESQVQVGFQDRVLIGKALIDPILLLQYRNVGYDRVDGQRFDNTGGHWIYLRPGLSWNLSPSAALRLTSDLPLWRKLDGTQLSTSYKITLSYFQVLNLKKKNSSPFPSLGK